MQKIDPAPLRKAIGAVKKSAADIQAARERETAISKEIDEFMDTVNAADEQAAKIVGSKRMMLGMMPHIIKKLEKAYEATIDQLVHESDSVYQQFQRAAQAEHGELMERIAGVLRPFCHSMERALAVAAQCDVLFTVPIDGPPSAQPVGGHRDNAPAAYDASVIARAEELLSVWEKWSKNGGFAPKDMSAAA